MQRLHFILLFWVGQCALGLLIGSTPVFSQLEDPREIIRDLQRQDKMLLNGIRLERRPPAQPIRIPLFRVAPVAPANRAYSLQLFESDGRLQFHRLTIGLDPTQTPHQLELSDQKEAQIVKHYLEQCKRLCNEGLSVCELNLAQIEKLEGAAVVDATRFVRNLRAQFAGTGQEQQARGLDPVRLRVELNSELAMGITSPKSLFRKILSAVVSPDQRDLLYRWRTSSLLVDINGFETLSLDAQVRKLGVSYPKPGEKPDLFVPLNPEQQEMLLKLIVDSHSGHCDLLELADVSQLPNLLQAVTENQLSELLSPPQVQAVLRQKEIVERQREYFQQADVVVDGAIFLRPR